MSEGIGESEMEELVPDDYCVTLVGAAPYIK